MFTLEDDLRPTHTGLRNPELRSMKTLVRKLLAKIRQRLQYGEPIIVYQMGKVGSSSVMRSLRDRGLSPVYHAHRLNPENIAAVRREHLARGQEPLDESEAERLYRDSILDERPAKFITLVREPIGGNISAFFENFEVMIGSEYAKSKLTLEQQFSAFLESYPHDVPLTWFDVELKATLGIDIYQHPFPRRKGWLAIRHGNFELLVLKLEIDDSIKEKAIESFLGISDIRLVRANVAAEKDYAGTYRAFLKKLVLPQEYLDRMCNARYTRHFYDDAEITGIRCRWQKRSHE